MGIIDTNLVSLFVIATLDCMNYASVFQQKIQAMRFYKTYKLATRARYRLVRKLGSRITVSVARHPQLGFYLRYSAYADAQGPCRYRPLSPSRV